MVKIAASVALAALLAGCASNGSSPLGRIMSYGGGTVDAKPVINGVDYTVSIHPKEDALLIRRPTLTTIAGGMVQGATMGLASPGGAYDPWKAAVAEFLRPTGCEQTDLYQIDDGFWEARFKCPEGVDLHKLVAAQRAQLRKGEALRP